MSKDRLYEISSSQIRIVEMASKAISGRRRAKLVLHEIFSDNTQWQSNGVSWLKKYTEQNMSTVEGMSVTVEFMDDKKREPYGHGYSGVNPASGMPEFNNAVMVGYTHSPKIEQLEINGKKVTVLTAEASLDQHRYPLFVDWLFSAVNSGNTINGSIEIVGAEEGKSIQYEAGEWTETGRVPTIYSYSGYAILGIQAADPSAVILELSSAKNQDNELSLIKEKIAKLELSNTTKRSKSVEEENNNMDEKKIMEQLTQINNQLTELNQARVQDEDVTKLKSENETLQAKVTELTDSVASITGEKDAAVEKVTELSNKIEQLEKDTLVAELNSQLAQFTEEQRKSAKAEIDKFMEKPNKSEINSIVAAVKIAIADKAIADAKVIAEQNAFNQNDDGRYSLSDIFGATDDPKLVAGEGNPY